MGSKLQKPRVEQDSEMGRGHDFNWGSSAMQGWRVTMEDSHIHQVTGFGKWSLIIFQGKLGHLQSVGLFLVFDGHGGSQYANRIAREFPTFLANENAIKKMEDDGGYVAEQIKICIREAFYKYDKRLHEEKLTSGCTASGVLITPHHIFVINIGDSRTIVCRDNEILFATEDHKPTCYNERIRIEEAGGLVYRRRVNGELAVSRALGDFKFKENKQLKQDAQLVTCDAEIEIIKRDGKTDELIIIGCDGIFDVMENSEIMDFCIKRIPYKRNLEELCNEITDYCCFKDSKDNLSVMVLKSDSSPLQIEPDKILHEEELNLAIRSHTKEYVDKRFAKGGSGYGWVPAFNKLNELHNETIFDVHENTQGLGISLKKGIIFREFDKLTTIIREKRTEEALQKLLADREKKEHTDQR